MIVKENINGKIFLKHIKFYVYENEDNLKCDNAAIVTSDYKLYNKLKKIEKENIPTKKIGKTPMLEYSRFNISTRKCGDTGVYVYLDDKRVGTIKHAKIRSGWQYYPLKSKIGGEVFQTIEEVKESLEI